MPVMLHMLMQAALGAWAAHWHARIAGTNAPKTAPYALAVATLAAALWLVPATTAQYLVAPDYAWSYLIDPMATPTVLPSGSLLATLLPLISLGLGYRASMACAEYPRAIAALIVAGISALAALCWGLGTEPLIYLGSFEQYWAHEATPLYALPWVFAIVLAYVLWALTYRAFTRRVVQWLA